MYNLVPLIFQGPVFAEILYSPAQLPVENEVQVGPEWRSRWVPLTKQLEGSILDHVVDYHYNTAMQ